jgi:hypothetical protein
MLMLKPHVIVLLALWALLFATGFFVTYVQQPREFEHVERAGQAARLHHAEVSSMLAEVSSSQRMADDAVRRWRARYKVIPRELSSHEIVGYLTELTATGFENFDVKLNGVNFTRDHSSYSFQITGRGHFDSLYRFVWRIENNRYFYRIHSLKLDYTDLIKKDAETERDRMEIMVSFTMTLEAYFGGAEGVSAPESSYTEYFEGPGLPASRLESIPPVPRNVLPDERPATNPFFPVIMERLPPNTQGLVDVEKATLIAIVGERAVFQDETGHRFVGVGEPVYLGQIVSVSTSEDRIVVRLNKGGITDEIELNLHAGERFRQAIGPARIVPAEE